MTLRGHVLAQRIVDGASTYQILRCDRCAPHACSLCESVCRVRSKRVVRDVRCTNIPTTHPLVVYEIDAKTERAVRADAPDAPFTSKVLMHCLVAICEEHRRAACNKTQRARVLELAPGEPHALPLHETSDWPSWARRALTQFTDDAASIAHASPEPSLADVEADCAGLTLGQAVVVRTTRSVLRLHYMDGDADTYLARYVRECCDVRSENEFMEYAAMLTSGRVVVECADVPRATGITIQLGDAASPACSTSALVAGCWLRNDFIGLDARVISQDVHWPQLNLEIATGYVCADAFDWMALALRVNSARITVYPEAGGSRTAREECDRKLLLARTELEYLRTGPVA
eukprot:gene9159-10856_t